MSTTEHPLWEDELMPYIDGQLQGESVARVTAHLAACSECRKTVEDTRKLSARMSQWEIETASDRMKDAVLSELHRKNRKSTKRWNRRWAWGVGAGGALAAAALLIVVAVQTRQMVGTYGIAPDIETRSGTQTFRYPAQDKQERAGRVGTVGKLQSASADQASGPMIIRTFHIALVAKDLDAARMRIDELVRQAHGYADQFALNGEKGSARTLSATLRFPADQVDTTLVELRKLGLVKAESQNSSDITSSYVDLVARQNNARNTEQRLLRLLQERTGSLKDVVEVERELSNTRGEIERMEAQRKTLQNQVQYATIQVEMSEEYRAGIEPPLPSTGNQIRNAAVEGYQLLSDTALDLTMVVLKYGPTLLLCTIIFAGAVYLALRLQKLKIVAQR